MISPLHISDRVSRRLWELVPEAVHRVVFDPKDGVGSLAESLLYMPELPKTTRLIWVDADPCDPADIPARDEAWRKALSRLNRYRNTIQARFKCTLVFAGPFPLQVFLREAAPDLWSIRSTVIRIEPVGSARMQNVLFQQFTPARDDLEGMGLAGDPEVTLAEAEKIRDKPGQELLLAQLLRRAGRQAYRLLNWDLALGCLQEACSREEAQGGDPEFRENVATELAAVFRQLAQWDRALHYSRKALEIAETSFGLLHRNTAIALNNHSQLLEITNQFAEAEPLMRRALRIDEDIFGPDHPQVAIILINLATLLYDTSRFTEAEILIRRALAIDEKRFGSNHPEVANDLNNLAQLLEKTNRLSEAESLMRRALQIKESFFSHNHPKITTELNNLAQLLRNTNRFSEAEPLMQRALLIDEASFGPNHPKVAVDICNLAQLFQDTSRKEEAEMFMRRALAIDEASFGPNHSRVAIHLNNLGQLLQDTNRPTEAEPLFLRALAIDEAILGPYHSDVAIDLNNLALLFQSTKRQDKAETLLRRALAIDEACYGTNHPTVAVDLINLAQLRNRPKRLVEAEPLMRRGLQILSSFGARNGYEHPKLQAAISSYCNLLKAMNQPQDEIDRRVQEALEQPQHLLEERRTKID